MQDAAQRGFEQDIEHGDHAEQIHAGRQLIHGGGQKLTEMGPGEDHGNQGGGAIPGQSAGDGHGGHFANDVFADHEQGFTDGGNRAGMSLHGGIGETQHPVTERSVAGDELFDPAQVGGHFMQGAEQAEIDEVILRNGPGGDENRLREEVALEERTALRVGDAHLDLGFEVAGEQLHRMSGRHGVDGATIGKIGGAEVNADEIGQFHERREVGPGTRNVESEAIALLSEAETGLEKVRVEAGPGVCDQNGIFGREQGDQTFRESRGGAQGMKAQPWLFSGASMSQ